MRFIVIDLDGSVVGQPQFRELIENGSAVLVPARDLAPRLRLVAQKKALATLQSRIGKAIGSIASTAEVVFYGSGDFHHVTTCLLARHVEPLTVVHIDNHPDWVAFPRTLNCGSWVNHALTLPNVRGVITLGPTGADLDWPELKFANLRAVADGRLRVVPWRKINSTVVRRYGDCRCWRQKGRKLEWVDQSGGLSEHSAQRLVQTIQTPSVYVTVDKDAFPHAEATTNWDQGVMTLREVGVLLRAIEKRKTIVGIDVCGDYSVPRFEDAFRRAISYFDRDRVGVTADTLAVNARTNEALMSMFSTLSRC